MVGFGNILKAELYKLAKGKSLIKVLIAATIIFIVLTVIFNFLYQLAGDYLSMGATSSQTVTAEDVEIARTNYETITKAVNELSQPQRMVNVDVYQAKALYNLYKYMYENNLSFSQVSIFGSVSTLTVSSYVMFMLQTMSMVFAVYAVVSIIRAIAGERANGTLKMQLLRPVSRDAMLAGKLLSVWIVTMALMLFYFLLSCVVGVIAFKIDTMKVIGIVNAEHVFIISAAGNVAIELLYYLSYLTAYIVMAAFVSNLFTKNEGPSIALGMVMLFIGSTVERLLGYIFVGYVGFGTNLNWMSALSTSGPTLNYMNLYSMLGISIAWFVCMLVSSVFMFRRAEINN